MNFSKAALRSRPGWQQIKALCVFIATCRVPQSWEVHYRDGSEWQPVREVSPRGTAMDTYNRVVFAPVQTSGLRLAVQLQPGWSSGILR